VRPPAQVALEDPTWTMDGVGEGDEKKLLQEFDKCARVYQRLEPAPRAVIADVTRRMADGMAEYVDKDLGEGTQTIDEYNRYSFSFLSYL
jgi:farnesyl-diphosphate farnesyltransferase